MASHFRRSAAALALTALFGLAPPAAAEAPAKSAARVERVLLLSIAGLHEFDLTRFVAAHPDSALAKLKKRGVAYSQARAPVPTDSFPGIIALTTGGLPKLTGVFYDDTWDRALSPAASDCSKRGGAAPFDADIDVDANKVDTAIDAAKLPRDPAKGCQPVWPHQYLRVNTIFDIAKAAGGRTAWADKHPSYEILQGPSGKGIDDLVTPEIAAAESDHETGKALANDAIRVSAVLNQIAGKSASGAAAPVPMIFGMNFEGFSVAQKYSAGYLDAAGAPNPEMSEAFLAIDQAIGRMVTALDAARLTKSTAIIVSAKHGQSPVDPGKKRIVDSKALKAAFGDAAAYVTADDVALVWLKDQAKAPAVAAALEPRKAELGIRRIYAGKALVGPFGDPAKDSRVPDLILEAENGVIYTKPSATKIAEHGGFNLDDRHVGLLVVAPGAAPHSVSAAVETRAVAPTVLRLLGLDARKLDAVAKTGVKPLPGLGL
jgi:hypothetical protein